MKDIPILYDIVKCLSQESFFDIFCLINILVSIVLFVYYLKRPMKYGRFYKTGTSSMKIEISSKKAMAIIHLFPLLFFVYFIFFYEDMLNPVAPITIPSIVWVLYSLYKGTLYAYKRSRYASVWPIETVILLTAINTCISLIAARVHMEGYEIPSLYGVLARSIIMLAAAIIGGISDFQISSLRYKNEKGYKVCNAFLFQYMSAPNFFCEFLFKIIWITYFRFDMGSVTFILWLLPLYYSRAEAIHRWNKKFFKGSYPAKRTAFIPFVDVSSILNVIIGSMEYGGF